MRRLLILSAILAGAATAALGQAPPARPHNVVLFVADGLRFRSVDDVTAPTMAALAREGVSLRNSHALFPTFTMANASVMATGHMLGDTGNFSNTIYTGFQVPSVNKTVTPFLESDPVLGDVDEHFSGNYLNEATILKLAHDQGFSTAAIGKVGPTLIFDHTDRTGTQTIIVDDATGSPKGIPLSAEMTERLKAASLPLAPPPRGASANYAGTTVANVVQQDYFAAVVTRAILPHVQGTRQAVRFNVLVARSRRRPAHPGRQPQFARARHQRPDLARRHPQRRRRSRAHPRRPRRARAPRDDRHHRGRRPRLFHDREGEQDQPDGADQIRQHAGGPASARLRRPRSRPCARTAADRS